MSNDHEEIFAFKNPELMLANIEEIRTKIQKGERITVYVNLKNKISEECLSEICDIIKAGVKVYWSEHVGDQPISLTSSEGHKKYRFVVGGYFNVVSGSFKLLQRLPRNLPDLDIFFRFGTNDEEKIPFFTYSDIMPDTIRRDSVFRVVYIANFSEHCTRSFYAPAEIFNEAVGFLTVYEGKGEKIEAESISEILKQKRYIEPRKKYKNEDYVTAIFRSLISEFVRKGYYIDPLDERTIYRYSSLADEKRR
jgi:hypothetical protein